MKFQMTTDHLLLMRKFNIGWNGCEAGAPCVDPKRPYGNGDVEADVCKILRWTMEGDDGDGPCWSSKQRDAARKRHESTVLALEVVMFFGKFEEGWYDRLGYQDWVKL